MVAPQKLLPMVGEVWVYNNPPYPRLLWLLTRVCYDGEYTMYFAAYELNTGDNTCFLHFGHGLYLHRKADPPFGWSLLQDFVKDQK